MVKRGGRVMVCDLIKCQQLTCEKADCWEAVRKGRKSEMWELQESTMV